MIQIAMILAVILCGCDSSVSQSTDHLRALGYHAVTCNDESRGEVFCVADGYRFRCAVHDPGGCNGHVVACERFEPMTPEKPMAPRPE